MQTFFNSLFAHCPLIWVFHNRELNTKINTLHHRALRIVYRDETFSFQDLLSRDGTLTIHQRNIHLLATEIYKVEHGLAPAFMSDIFSRNHNLNANNASSNTRSKPMFYCTDMPHTVRFGSETLRYI